MEIMCSYVFDENSAARKVFKEIQSGAANGDAVPKRRENTAHGGHNKLSLRRLLVLYRWSERVESPLCFLACGTRVHSQHPRMLHQKRLT